MFIALIFASMFQIIPNADALRMIEAQNGIKFSFFEHNKAVSYQLQDGKFVILPLIGDSALLFESKSEYLTFAKSPDFPASTNQPFSKYQNELKTFEEKSEVFNDIVKQKYNVEPLQNEDDLKRFFNVLNNNKIDNEDFYLNDLVPVGMVIGNFLKKEYNLNWNIQTTYTFQPFVVPYLTSKSSSNFDIWSILEEYMEEGSFDSDDFLFRFSMFYKTSINNSRSR